MSSVGSSRCCLPLPRIWVVRASRPASAMIHYPRAGGVIVSALPAQLSRHRGDAPGTRSGGGPLLDQPLAARLRASGGEATAPVPSATLGIGSTKPTSRCAVSSRRRWRCTGRATAGQATHAVGEQEPPQFRWAHRPARRETPPQSEVPARVATAPVTPAPTERSLCRECGHRLVHFCTCCQGFEFRRSRCPVVRDLLKDGRNLATAG